ncbi:Sec-independent protein translocase subunit TatA [Cryobacterium sp. SO2]|uniref:Sec-independent protein translocase subunit TatA n=1 Tax=Cryobacterium sp. SO2 TaxID=1897060 RepID=UPI00223CA8FA|nr:Sec-independent protein translocase subunit TatA [Cryobacterium sp. SO2]WEO75987.1 Sec-independent protein translocase subunit TatA [Cryobacterium sp. SO2]
MFANLTGWHMVIILAIVLLLFGAPKLPGLARSVGQSMRIFKSEVKTLKDDDPADASDPASPTASPLAPTVIVTDPHSTPHRAANQA